MGLQIVGQRVLCGVDSSSMCLPGVTRFGSSCMQATQFYNVFDRGTHGNKPFPAGVEESKWSYWHGDCLPIDCFICMVSQTKDDPPNKHPSPGYSCSQKKQNHIETHNIFFEAYLILFVHFALKMQKRVMKHAKTIKHGQIILVTFVFEREVQ